MLSSFTPKKQLAVNWAKPFRDGEFLFNMIDLCPDGFRRECYEEVIDFDEHYRTFQQLIVTQPQNLNAKAIYHLQMVIFALWKRIPEQIGQKQVSEWKKLFVKGLLENSNIGAEELINNNKLWKSQEGLGDMDVFYGANAIKSNGRGFIENLNETCHNYPSILSAFQRGADTPLMPIKEFLKINAMDSLFLKTNKIRFLYSIIELPMAFFETKNGVGKWVAMNWINQFPWESEVKDSIVETDSKMKEWHEDLDDLFG